MDSPGEDRLISVIPVHFSNTLVPNVQLHQYPLLNRPLQVPPSAAASGKRIRARIKPSVRRLEVHVPVDSRPEVWNAERSKELGSARATDDKERNQEPSQKGKQRETEEHRLSEIRLRGEPVPHNGAYVLGVVRDGVLHLHPISETYQLRPTLTYMDVLSRKSRRPKGNAGSDDDSDDGPPPDPDEPAPAPAAPKKEKKKAGEAKEVQVSVRKVVDDKGLSLGGGLTAVRREMLMAIRSEEDERWEDYEYCDGEAAESNDAFERVLSSNEEILECKTNITKMLKDIKGL
ncbi:DNA-directed RNA polymerase III subunit Rpc5 [Cristinia sonorae]|uniref:DNA-directed RNA polymerase III subunit Rpc5 n=1 Tax=Cristinia sonorae TaxID=1940300 RepID=A0A8K0UNG8_9AGAR|nr:DNA-directed RNA polymerase III subunit Rpc5 [Cristinia sonorae]